jgi:hypothetical protein
MNYTINKCQTSIPYDINLAISTITFISVFDEPLDKYIYLFADIKHIIICGLFNQPISNLPNTIESLIIRSTLFDQSLEHLPISLKKLIIITIPVNHKIEYLPDSIEYLEISDNILDTIYDNLPQNLKVLKITNCLYESAYCFTKPLNNLPKGLEFLEMPYYYNHPLINLPSGLITLELGHCFNHPLSNLPKGLKKLVIESLDFDFEHNLYPFDLPDSLEQLICYYGHNLVSYMRKKYDNNGKQAPKLLDSRFIYWN